MQQTYRQSVMLALVVFAAAFIIYAIWLPVTFTGDDFQYATEIQRSVLGDVYYHPTGTIPYIPQAESDQLQVPPALPRLNVRYILEWPTSALVGTVWKTLGWQGDMLIPIQSARIAVGALALVFFFMGLRQLTPNPLIQLLCTAGVGVGAAYWNYSTHPDQSINMVLFLAAGFWVFARQFKHGATWRGRLLLVALVGLATLYNFTATMSAVAFGFGMALIQAQGNLPRRFLVMVGFGLMYGLAIALTVILVILLLAPPNSLFSSAFWQDTLFVGKPEYNINLLSDTARAVIALGKSQVVFPGVPGSLSDFFEVATTTQQALLLLFYAAVLAVLLMPVVYLLIRLGRLGRTRLMLGFLLVWIATHSLFNWFWDPGFDKYWLVPLMALWAIMALALDFALQNAARWHRPAVGIVVAFIILGFGINLTTRFLPESQPENNPWRTIALEMKTQSEPRDLFIGPSHPLAFYLTYLSRRNTISTGLIAYGDGGDDSRVSQIIARTKAAHQADGGTIYVFGLERMTETEQATLLEQLGGGTLSPAWEFPGTTIHAYQEST